MVKTFKDLWALKYFLGTHAPKMKSTFESCLHDCEYFTVYMFTMYVHKISQSYSWSSAIYRKKGKFIDQFQQLSLFAKSIASSIFHWSLSLRLDHSVTKAQSHKFRTSWCYHSQWHTRVRSQYRYQPASSSTFAPKLALGCTWKMISLSMICDLSRLKWQIYKGTMFSKKITNFFLWVKRGETSITNPL